MNEAMSDAIDVVVHHACEVAATHEFFPEGKDMLRTSIQGSCDQLGYALPEADIQIAMQVLAERLEEERENRRVDAAIGRATDPDHQGWMAEKQYMEEVDDEPSPN